ncbi:hypothetical protein [Stenotrophomonas phage CM2]
MVSADTALGQRIDTLSAVVDGKASAQAVQALTVRVTNVENKAGVYRPSGDQVEQQPW